MQDLSGRPEGRKRRKDIFKFIIKFAKEHPGVSASFQEIMAGTGISSTSVVSYHLKVMEELGIIYQMRQGDGQIQRRSIVIIGAELVFKEEVEEDDETAGL